MPATTTDSIDSPLSPAMAEQDNRTTHPNDESHDTVFDVVVIGGGVVGLSILRQATLSGYQACVVERESDLAMWASGSNSGVVCTGVDAPHGSLERSLIRESISTIRYHCRALKVPVRECGSLVCSWPWTTTKTHEGDDDHDMQQEEGLDEVLEQSHMVGDAHARRLSQEEVRILEPALNRQCLGAVHIPGEFVVDSWLYTISLATHAKENGATVFVDFDVDLDGSTFDETSGLWTLVDRKTPNDTSLINTPRSVRGRSVVNASGVWSDHVEEKLAGGCDWKSMPRRGQYLVLADSALRGESTLLTLTRPIQPVPSLHTKGVFVFSSMYQQIVVGPTATEQASRDDRSPDPRVRHELLDVARRVLPSLDLNEKRVVGEYVGIRPATDRRDYQIRLDSRRHWVACAGIRSTGLTASLGIGRHVVHLLQHEVLPRVEQLDPHHIRTTPLPPLDDLVREFRQRHDGKVTIHGHEYKVTHPLTVMGWKGAPLDEPALRT